MIPYFRAYLIIGIIAATAIEFYNAFTFHTAGIGLLIYTSMMALFIQLNIWKDLNSLKRR